VLLENVIQPMNLRLLPDRNNDESIVDFNCFDVLEPSTWPYEELTLPWIAGKEKLCQVNEILKHVIDLNDFRDFVDSNLVRKCSSSFTYPES
jgi:hypothetical protein